MSVAQHSLHRRMSPACLSSFSVSVTCRVCFPRGSGSWFPQPPSRVRGGRQLSLWGYMRNREGGAWEALDVPGS